LFAGVALAAVVLAGLGLAPAGNPTCPVARAQSRTDSGTTGGDPRETTGAPGCDPYTQMLPVDIPASQRAVCGDGRARRG
jgi:hypothetical protein